MHVIAVSNVDMKGRNRDDLSGPCKCPKLASAPNDPPALCPLSKSRVALIGFLEVTLIAWHAAQPKNTHPCLRRNANHQLLRSSNERSLTFDVQTSRHSFRTALSCLSLPFHGSLFWLVFEL